MSVNEHFTGAVPLQHVSAIHGLRSQILLHNSVRFVIHWYWQAIKSYKQVRSSFTAQTIMIFQATKKPKLIFFQGRLSRVWKQHLVSDWIPHGGQLLPTYCFRMSKDSGKSRYFQHITDYNCRQSFMCLCLQWQTSLDWHLMTRVSDNC